MGLAPDGSNNYENRGCNYLVLIPDYTYLLEIYLCKNLRKSVHFGPKRIIWYFNHFIPVVFILASYLCWEVWYGFIIYIYRSVATFHVWNFVPTTSFIMGLMCIHKTSDSWCNHKYVFSCDPNCTHFTLLVACLRDPFIIGAFIIIALLQLTPFQTGQILSLFVGEEYIWIANVHTINSFVISTSSFVTPSTNTVISSTKASKAPSTMFVTASSSSVHHVDTAPALNTARLGGNHACLSC